MIAGTTLVLHNIRSVYNVGSIFRTADAAGVSKIILSGYTPSPLDRFGRERRDFTKVSLGAEKSVPWETTANIRTAIVPLKNAGCLIVAIEQDARSTPLFDWNPPKDRPLAIILGNEVRGISKQSLKFADVILELPMRGAMVRQAHHPRRTRLGKESLNVSVTAGIALFTLLRSCRP